MAEVQIDINSIGFDGNTEELETAIVKLQKTLSWLLEHLDSRNVRTINTNQTAVTSEDGSTKIDGAQIVMYDEDDTLRARIGKNAEGIFEFQIFDAAGALTVHLNDSGDAVFRGDIEGANIEGANIRIAPNTFQDYIALENDGTEDTLALYCAGVRIGGIRMLEAGGMEIFGNKISIGSSAGTVSVACGASGTFSAGGKDVTVQKGIITDIT